MKADDTSVSRLSDTASKVAGLETRFQQMESQFSSSFARLEAMLYGLGTHGLAATNGSSGSTNPPVHSSVNLPAPDYAGGPVDHRAAGTG
jgi:hypothetical protein